VRFPRNLLETALQFRKVKCKKTLGCFEMKHTLKITIVLLVMFVVTQFIGLYVVNHYQATGNNLPFGMETPPLNTQSDFNQIFISLVFAFAVAISLLFFLTKFRAEFFLKLWFFVVVMIALGISFLSFIPNFKYASLVVLLVALPLAFVKIYRRGFIVHNLTELLIYPGIAAVFVPILNIYTIVALLILISVYDIWAVWHSGIMQKMAKYQIDKLNVFSGFFVPYADRKTRKKIKMLKEKVKNKKISKKDAKTKKFKVSVAILGGGDIIFPIIAAGVMLKTLGLASAIFVIIGATLGVSYLFFFAEKKKFYPAMPYITAGIFLAMVLSYLIF
jgi:presenilin-like A22 family membrane protease